MMYWLQLGTLFRKMSMHMPFLILRNSLFLLKEHQWLRWKEKGFAPKDIFLGREDIEKKYATLVSEGFSVEDAQAKITAIYASLIQRVSEIDASLTGMAEAEKTKHLTALKQLETRVMRAVKQKEETGLRQVLKIKDHLFPNGAMMERSEAGILYAEDGMSHLIDLHKEHLSPFGFGAVLVVEGVEKNDS
jgi:uncharacterized protein YllA (UPF0747 family)